MKATITVKLEQLGGHRTTLTVVRSLPAGSPGEKLKQEAVHAAERALESVKGDS